MFNFAIRELEEKDLENGFFETLSFLRPVGELSEEKSSEILQHLRSNPLHKIFVALDDGGHVVGATTIFVEPKFIHQGGKAGHLEDVVTHEKFRNQGIASALIKKALDFAKQEGCYKVILDCSKDNAPFYEKLGFKKHHVEMRFNME